MQLCPELGLSPFPDHVDSGLAHVPATPSHRPPKDWGSRRWQMQAS